jgi:5-methylcytosine-specific restriction endonuclease McrBC regulatory subunit McrC
MKVHVNGLDMLERTNNIIVHLERASIQKRAMEMELEQIKLLEPDNICWNIQKIIKQLEGLRAFKRRLYDGMDKLFNDNVERTSRAGQGAERA